MTGPDRALRLHATLAALAALAFAACGNEPGAGTVLPDLAPPAPPPAIADPARDIVGTELWVDLTKLGASARITLAPSSSKGASFEAGGLMVSAVRGAAGPLAFSLSGGRLDVGIADDGTPQTLTVDSTFGKRPDFSGYLSGGSTLIWPYYCGNLFPCHSDPRDGITFSVNVTGAPMGQITVVPDPVTVQAPSYMLAWATGAYAMLDLGKTDAGTQIVAWYLPGGEAAARTGTATLRQVFDWYEKTYGAYYFGSQAGSVSVRWRQGAYGGMEHHPLWHIAEAAMSDPWIHAHEAAHGWFGDGVRIACWEDFALSEGTVSYLEARAVAAVSGAMQGQALWDDYRLRLDAAMGRAGPKAPWPLVGGCDLIDILKDGYFGDLPYMKGAFFLRALELKIGVAAVDKLLGGFFVKYRGKAAGLQDLVDEIKASSGYDATACATAWLRQDAVPKAPACP